MKAQLNDAIEDYVVLRQSQDYSKATLRNERGVLMRFLTVNGNIYLHNISERHITRYFEEASKTRGPNSLTLDHLVLNQFFDWARRTRRMGPMDDPMFGRRRPKTYRREKDRLHVSQFPRLLEAAGKRDPRDRAIDAVLIYTLLREQEAASLRLYDVDLESGYITARIHKSRTEDRIPICAELDAELRMWITHYTQEAGPLRPNAYLLPRRRSVGTKRDDAGRILSHSTVYAPDEPVSRPGKLVVQHLEDIGYQVRDASGRGKGEGCHTLRRSGARAFFDVLVDTGYDHALRIIQSMLHHSSVTVTEGYLGITADRRTRDELIRGKILYPDAWRASQLERIVV